MSEIDVNINKLSADLSMISDNIDIELSTYTENMEVKPEDIVIEISGLTTINGFIGLSDTPLYYEDGKFFKVVGNKIEYTDITFEDIKGDIPEDSELYTIISQFVDNRIEELSGTVIDDKIHAHSTSPDAHTDIRNDLQNVNDTLNTQIELNKIELTQEISNNSENISVLQNETETLKNNLEDLTLSVEVDIAKDIEDNKQNIEKNTQNITNNYTEFKETSTIISVKVDKNTEDIKAFAPVWNNIEDLLN